MIFLRSVRQTLSAFLIAVFAVGAMPPAAFGQQPVGNAASSPGLTVATRNAPPFAVRDEQGEWSGIAIDLWRDVAEDEQIAFRFVETDLLGMTQGVADGRFDASVGALTITSKREEIVDFTQPYFTTGFAIAVPKGPPDWLGMLGGMLSWQFLQVVGLLALVLLVVGTLFWLAERKINSDEFPSGASGIGAGFWFSAVTMTTVGYGDKAPRTPAGKIVALVWMFTALIIVSTFTGMIASTLTAGRLSSQITGPGDLAKAKVGAIASSAARSWLRNEGISTRDFADVEAGLAALNSGRIDAFVHDAPILAYVVNRGHADQVELLGSRFGRQDYGFALPTNSKLREPLNVALLHRIEDNSWLAQVDAEIESVGRDDGEAM